MTGRGAGWSLGRHSQLFQRRGRGRRAESRGKPKGRTQGFWTPGYFGELCAETRGDSGTGRQAPSSAATRKPRGRGEVAAGEPGCAAARTARRASREAGHLPSGTEKLGPEASLGRGFVLDFFSLLGCAGISGWQALGDSKPSG